MCESCRMRRVVGLISTAFLLMSIVAYFLAACAQQPKWGRDRGGDQPIHHDVTIGAHK